MTTHLSQVGLGSHSHLIARSNVDWWFDDMAPRKPTYGGENDKGDLVGCEAMQK